MSRSSRAVAALVAALFLLPLAPVAAASGECGGAPCGDLTLFPHPDGSLTSLVGDDVVAIPPTSPFVSKTAPLASTMSLAKQSTFRLHITSEHPESSPIMGHVTVFAEDLQGARHMLARRDFTPTNASAPTGSLRPALESVDGPINGTLANFDGGHASMVLDLAHARFCSPPNAFGGIPCSSTSGDPGSGQLRPCAPAQPFGLVPQAVWLAGQTADAALQEQTGERICGRSAWNTTAPYAEQADDDLDVIPAYPGTASLAGNDSSLPASGSWSTIELNATPPAWLAQDATSFALPSGLALGFEIAIRSYTPTPSGTFPGPYVIIQYGHAGAPTRLETRTAAPLPFGALAGATQTIGDGAHAGFLATPFEIDDYGFEAPAGKRIEIRTQAVGIAANYTLLSPHGEARSGTRIDAPGQDGRWTLRVARGYPTSGATLLSPEYEFNLRLLDTPASEPDDGRTITEGGYQGTLGGGDDGDSYAFDVWKRQRFTLTLTHPPSADFDIDLGSTGVWEVQRTDLPDGERLSARAKSTGPIDLRVTRAWGEGAYAITLDLDEDGDLSNVPLLATRYLADPSNGTTILSDLGADAARVIFSIREGESEAIVALDADGALTQLRSGRGSTAPPALTADGALLYRDSSSGRTAVSIDDGATVDPLIREPGVFGFGAHALYATAGGSGSSSEIIALNEHRASSSLPLPAGADWRELLAAPDGAIYLLAMGTGRAAGEAYRADFAAGNVTRTPAYDGAAAFDDAGHGYRIVNSTLVERFDPTTGAARVVARSEYRIEDVAAVGLHLYAILSGGALGERIVAVAPLPVNVEGFGGFRPAFDPPAAPDLLVTGVEDIPLGPQVTPSLTVVDAHEIRLTVTNQGGSAAGPILVSLSDVGPLGGTVQDVTVGPLTAGASAVATFHWTFDRSIGDQTLIYKVDVGSRDVVESNETNNLGEFLSAAHVGGNRALCLQALTAASVPPIIAGAICRIGD